jgi:hypothetical protein
MWLLRPPAACRQPPPHPRPALAPTSLAATVSLNCLPTSSFFSSSFLNSSFSASSRNCGQAGAEADAWWQAAWCRARRSGAVPHTAGPFRCLGAQPHNALPPLGLDSELAAPSTRTWAIVSLGLPSSPSWLPAASSTVSPSSLCSLKKRSRGPGVAWPGRREGITPISSLSATALRPATAAPARHSSSSAAKNHGTAHFMVNQTLGAVLVLPPQPPCKGIAASVSAAKPFRPGGCQLPRMIYDC